jgi:ABC-type sugar transport system ATPase subunit
LGLAGLTGSGRSNVLEIIFGARKPVFGSIELDGVVLTLKHPADAVSKGIALVTEDRKRNGYVPMFPIWQHITLPWLSHYTDARFLLDLRLERKRAREACTRLDVRARSVNSEMRELSGGNQQKAILARWLSQKLRVLLLDEPTHGVDIGAKEEIYRIIRSLAQSGLPIVVVSSEFEELEGLCDRVLLLVEGRLIGELRGTDIDHARIVHALFQRSMEPVADVN